MTEKVCPPTLELWVVAEGATASVIIRGTPEDFQLLADCAAQGGGVVIIKGPVVAKQIDPATFRRPS